MGRKPKAKTASRLRVTHKPPALKAGETLEAWAVRALEGVCAELLKSGGKASPKYVAFFDDPSVYEGYAERIARPVWLRQIAARCVEYSGFEGFEADVAQLVQNCRQFNGDRSPYTAVARELEKEALLRLAAVKAELAKLAAKHPEKVEHITGQAAPEPLPEPPAQPLQQPPAPLPLPQQAPRLAAASAAREGLPPGEAEAGEGFPGGAAAAQALPGGRGAEPAVRADRAGKPLRVPAGLATLLRAEAEAPSAEGLVRELPAAGVLELFSETVAARGYVAKAEQESYASFVAQVKELIDGHVEALLHEAERPQHAELEAAKHPAARWSDVYGAGIVVRALLLLPQLLPESASPEEQTALLLGAEELLAFVEVNWALLSRRSQSD